ncbi:conserved hypothetical protein [Desulfamplus magnetovallimortis]|uniref:Uncharacterized protein n=1 Tax=Desulfamplus magnetovallimortis TaxID=1246637 RepID=A0A1W1HG52_9BACT|nr:hypothetical protein [Desulfamplus magnetovallimortis]SLM31362.1 conserved hypothetical protein [Desulfamplus magnetovallimortis]
MIEHVYIHTKVEKEFQRLQDQENTPAFAAKKAEQIIHSLATGTKPVHAGKLSRNGDARIKKCLKYDLGKGYRMICVKERKAVYVLYTGSHDSCDTWLDKNRNLKIDNFLPNLNLYEHQGLSCRANSSVTDPMEVAHVDGGGNKAFSIKTDIPDLDEEADYDDILMEKITQKDLREIFQGFIQ